MPHHVHADSNPDIVRHLEKINWLTEDYPPFNYIGEDGEVTGIAVDILKSAFQKMGGDFSRTNLSLLSWSKAYEHLLRNSGTALFSMTYTPERQKIMKFVGPIMPSQISIIAPNAKNLSITSEADLSALVIGVIKDDIGDQLIKKYALGDSWVHRTTSLKKLIRLLQSGRVDVVAYASTVFRHSLIQNGFNPADFEDLFVLKKGQLGYAFNKSVDADVLGSLQKAIDEMRAQGAIDQIVKKYNMN